MIEMQDFAVLMTTIGVIFSIIIFASFFSYFLANLNIKKCCDSVNGTYIEYQSFINTYAQCYEGDYPSEKCGYK